MRSRAAITVGATALVTSTGAIAQTITQTLTVDFALLQPVPIGRWSMAVVALLLAVSGALLVRYRARARVWIWPTLAIGVAAFVLAESVTRAEAIVPVTTPLGMTSSPAQVTFTFPGAPPFTNVVATNNVSGIVTITGISLDSGPYGLAKGTAGVPCKVGLNLQPGQQCSILLLAAP